jgi:hypothetical protein
MIQEWHTGIGRRMSNELSRAISGKRLVRKYATKSIPAFLSPDVLYFPRSAFVRVLISPHYLHEQSHGISPLYMVVFSCHEHRTIATNKQWRQCEKGIVQERPQCSIPSNADPTLAGKCQRAQAVFGRSAVASVQPPSIQHVNVHESRRTSCEFSAAVLKTQPAPVCLRSVRRFGKTNKRKQVPVRVCARAAISPRWCIFSSTFYINYRV